MSNPTASAAGGAMPASGHTADHPDAALFALAEECAVAFREREKVTDHLNAVEAEFEPVPAPAAIKKTKRDFELGLYLGNANFDYDKSEIAAIRTLCRTICHRPSPSELDLERFRRCKEVIGAWTAWQDAFTREKERSGVATANRAWDEATDKSDDIAERLARMPAATIEGVGVIRKFFGITLPLLKPTLITSALLMTLHDLKTRGFVHGSLRSRATVGPNTSSATRLASSPSRISTGSTISRSRAVNSRCPGVRNQCSSRTSDSEACVSCRTSQFPARERRGSRNAVGIPCV